VEWDHQQEVRTMTRPDEDLAPSDRAGRLDPDERDIEAPDEDVAEQSVSANPVDEPAEVRRGLEVNEWDAVEQSIVVDMDDDYDH
jgi:hypothetical protein